MSTVKRELIIAGAGTGSIMQLTPEVKRAVEEADVVFVDERLRSFVPPDKKVIHIMTWWNLVHESGKVVMLVSGDAGIFSLLPIIKRHFPNEKLTVLPGISSLQAVCAAACETWHDAAIISGHGLKISRRELLNTVERKRITILFCDGVMSPSWACKNLKCLKNIDVVIGSCLGGENEQIFRGTPCEFSEHKFPSLSIILIRNSKPYAPERMHLRDEDFIRSENIVMTNESVRSVIMTVLELKGDSVFWDIGAGSGSISVSAGNENPFADIHAVECNPKAAALIRRNSLKFHLHNIAVHRKRALKAIVKLPKPTHVFIGGSDGELSGILKYISRIDECVRVVAACVTLETFAEAYEILKGWENFGAVQISAVSSKPLTPSLTMMKANNPVMILSANSKQKFSIDE